ncbi:MAG: IS4 family transposase [Methylococcaceae bacterium]|nr:IS4 family transposase [Methylococcaceae bacterium]
MAHNNTAFQQLLQPLSRHGFERLAKQHHTGQTLRSATRWDQFIGMAMSQLSGRQSLRDIESNLKAQQDKLYHLGAKPIPRSTLARINEKQPSELYKAVFYKLLRQCQKAPSKHKFRFKNPLYSLDASAINLSIKLFPWALHQPPAANVKLSVGLNHGNMLPEFVALSDGNENDRIQGRKFDFPAGSIVAFDKGYNDYEWFKELSNQKVNFVTRLRLKSVYEVLEDFPVIDSKGIISDQTIQFNSTHALKRGVPKLRLVTYYDNEGDKTYQFLTNNFKLCAATIASIYKDRWQVELFFKAIKQNLKIHAFVGVSRNAVMTQIWIAMITYLLLAYARHSAKTGWTVQRILRVIQLNLFERKNLREILIPDPPRHKKEVPQMRLSF